MTEKLLIALAAGARAFADVLSPCSALCGSTPPAEPPVEEPKTRKPRATKEPPAPAAPEQAPVELVSPGKAGTGDLVHREVIPTEDGISDDDLKSAVAPLVEDGRAAEVKTAILKYGASLTKIAPDKRKAFLKDIEALSL